MTDIIKTKKSKAICCRSKAGIPVIYSGKEMMRRIDKNDILTLNILFRREIVSIISKLKIAL